MLPLTASSAWIGCGCPFDEREAYTRPESTPAIQAIHCCEVLPLKGKFLRHSSAPLFKVYLINGHDLFFGYYPVVEHAVTINKKQVPIYDPMGKDAVLFHHVADADPDSTGSLYVAETAKWFDSVWDTIARPYEQ